MKKQASKKTPTFAGAEGRTRPDLECHLTRPHQRHRKVTTKGEVVLPTFPEATHWFVGVPAVLPFWL